MRNSKLKDQEHNQNQLNVIADINNNNKKKKIEKGKKREKWEPRIIR